MERLMDCPGLTVPGRPTAWGASMRSPLTKTREYEEFHVQVPTFWIRHVLVKSSPDPITVPSSIETSEMKAAALQSSTGAAVRYGVAPDRVGKPLVAVAVMGVAVTTWSEASFVWAAA